VGDCERLHELMATMISGRVTVEHGGAGNAVVELHNATDDVLTQIAVDEDGRYRFYVTEGIWRLVAWDPHGHRGAAEAKVTRGEDRRLDVRLE
jgi:hypothetical protein